MKKLIIGIVTLASASSFSGEKCTYTSDSSLMPQSEAALQSLGYEPTSTESAELGLVSYADSSENVRELLVTYKAKGWAQVQTNDGSIVTVNQSKLMMEFPHEGGLGYSPAKRTTAYNLVYKKIDQKTANSILKKVEACN